MCGFYLLASQVVEREGLAPVSDAEDVVAAARDAVDVHSGLSLASTNTSSATCQTLKEDIVQWTFE